MSHLGSSAGAIFARPYIRLTCACAASAAAADLGARLTSAAASSLSRSICSASPARACCMRASIRLWTAWLNTDSLAGSLCVKAIACCESLTILSFFSLRCFLSTATSSVLGGASRKSCDASYTSASGVPDLGATAFRSSAMSSLSASISSGSSSGSSSSPAPGLAGVAVLEAADFDPVVLSEAMDLPAAVDLAVHAVLDEPVVLAGVAALPGIASRGRLFSCSSPVAVATSAVLGASELPQPAAAVQRTNPTQKDLNGQALKTLIALPPWRS